MRFDAREVKPYAEPVLASDLKPGEIYFFLQFVDPDLLIPILDPYVFIGREHQADEDDAFLFQDASSHLNGVRPGSAENDQACFCCQGAGQLNQIFEYEKALNLLMLCSIRRKEKLRNRM